MSGFWTPEREQELARLADGTLSAGEIGMVLGCTRNAVVGKIMRGKGAFGRLGSHAAAVGRIRPSYAAPRQPKPSASALSLPAVLPMTFGEAVDRGRCLWFTCAPMDPSGPDMPVCGAERAVHAPASRYCAHHHALQVREKVPA